MIPAAVCPAAGLYVHIPFCAHKCRYCDFVSYTGELEEAEAYIESVLHELRLSLPNWPDRVFDSVYIGGGTPTLLPASIMEQLVTGIRELAQLTPDVEFTVEANPNTIDEAVLSRMLSVGVNRLSIGVQSWNDAELRLLGRSHSAESAREACLAARQAGFLNLSLDLMLGLPQQTLMSWTESLNRSLELEPEHLSLYTLTIEQGTPLADDIRAGRLIPAGDDACAAMYATARELLARSGYTQYELSNWAKDRPATQRDRYPLLASRHNLHYWHNEHYLGLGVAAFSYDGAKRWGNTRSLNRYLQAINADQLPVAESEILKPGAAMGETVMLGLRLLAGVRWNELARRFGLDARIVYARQIEKLAALGLLCVDMNGMRLAENALYVANRVLCEFV